MEDVFGIGAGKVGSEGNVERVVDGNIGGRLRVRNGQCSLGCDLLVRIYCRHAHIRPGHAEVWTHPLGPVTHVCQLIHGGTSWSLGEWVDRWTARDAGNEWISSSSSIHDQDQ